MPAGTERQKVGLGWVIIWSIECKKCHTKEGSATVDVGLVELDRGESRLLDWSRGWSRGCRVCGGGDRRHLRKRVHHRIAAEKIEVFIVSRTIR